MGFHVTLVPTLSVTSFSHSLTHSGQDDYWMGVVCRFLPQDLMRKSEVYFRFDGRCLLTCSFIFFFFFPNYLFSHCLSLWLFNFFFRFLSFYLYYLFKVSFFLFLFFSCIPMSFILLNNLCISTFPFFL